MGCGVIMTVLQNNQLIKLEENAIKISKSNLISHNQTQNGNLSQCSLLKQKQNKQELPKPLIIKKQRIDDDLNKQRLNREQKENIGEKKEKQQKEKIDLKQEIKLQQQPSNLLGKPVENVDKLSKQPTILKINPHIQATQKIEQKHNKTQKYKAQKPIIMNPIQKKQSIQVNTNQNVSIQKMPQNKTKRQSMEVQSIQASQPIKEKQPSDLGIRNLNKKSSKNLNKNDISRKSLKVKKEMVHVDSLYLQSVITKPEQPQLQKSPIPIPTVRPYSKEEAIRVPSRKGKNEPIQIVDNLAEIDKNIQSYKIDEKSISQQQAAVQKARQPSKKQLVTKKIEQIKKNAQKKKEDEKKMEASRKKLDQKTKSEQSKKMQQVKKKIEEEQKKNIEVETNKLKKVYNV